MRYRWFCFALSLALLAALAPAAVGALPAGPSFEASQSAPQAVPAGFVDTVILDSSKVDEPTAIDWLPDGRMLVSQQTGEVKVISGTAVLGTTDLGDKVCSDFERGLLGLAVDPHFDGSNPFVYLFYTFNKHNQQANACQEGGNVATVPVNRVSRFRLVGNQLDQPSEEVLVDNMISYGGNHNAGDVHFGKDGKLYISVGDGGSDYAGGGGGGSNDASRDKHMLLGKILRINPDGSLPSDNPFLGAGTVRCNVNGQGAAGNHCQETWAWGFRNPFRFAMDEDAADTVLRINDVGQNAWEEIDDGQAGADYGWNCREATHTNNTSGPCNPTPPAMVEPIFEYKHGSNPSPSPFQGCNSITGGDFIPDGAWPAEYENGYLFSDYVCGKMFLLKNGTVSEFATNLGGSTAVHLVFGPHATPQGPTKALYYTTYRNGGEVRRISLNGLSASMIATPTSGPAPLAVQFDASGSVSADGSALTYHWDFGDGTPASTTNTPITNHAYATGSYTATLYVSVAANVSTIVSQVIVSGDSPPSPTIVTPAGGATFAVGDQITLLGTAIDGVDGTLAPNKLSWNVLRHHAAHTHPYFAAPMTNTASFAAPPPEDLLAATNSFLEIQLTATDSAGLSKTVTRTLQPKKVDITFNSVPDNLHFTVNGSQVDDNDPIVSWQNWDLDVDAPLQLNGGTWWRFQEWADSQGAVATRTITTPAAATTYTATFEAAPYQFIPLLVR